MIKMLQKKFVFTAMVAVLVLIIFLVGTINVINYWMVEKQAVGTLNMLSKNEGELPPRMGPKERPELFVPPMKEDMAMSAGFFSVRLDAKGEIVYMDISRISSITEAEAEEIALEVFDGGTDFGSLEHFKYRKTNSDDGRGCVVVFLDTSAQLYSIFLVLAISVTIGILCFFLMLLLVTVLSKKAIYPIARNIKKQKQFVTNAGHEIKTPLAIIQANTDALELHNGESKWSRNIRTQTVRLGGLMQNLLTLAKMEEGISSLTATDFSISLLLEETLYPFYEPAALKGIQIAKDIQPDLLLHASRENMMQLISILLDNAAKYTNPGGEITVTLRKREKGILLSIKNSCATLPNQDLNKLFERFYRGDSARTQKSGGYGIGLSVAQAIVDSHKGSISAAAPAPHTIVFIVKL